VVTGRILLVNPAPETLTKGLDGNIRAEDQANLEPAAEVQLAVGALETSNVNPIASMVQMIELSRSFEGHIQTMKSADELDASSASLMRLE
jgi:flagellar basal-body rod protein FlgF